MAVAAEAAEEAAPEVAGRVPERDWVLVLARGWALARVPARAPVQVQAPVRRRRHRRPTASARQRRTGR